MSVDLVQRLKTEARQLGFDHCRVAPIGPARHGDFFASWLARGNAGEMHYLARNVDLRRNPAGLAGEGDAFRSLIVLAVDYHQFDLPPVVRDDPSRGLVATYAWGDDYHEIIRPLLYALDSLLRRHSGRRSQGKALVDSGPVLERDWAQRAGIGFTGKNCCTIRPGQGSWLLLATLAVPELLAYDSPPHFVGNEPAPAHVLAGLVRPAAAGQWCWPAAESATGLPRIGTCGQCTRCMDVCPTDAFVGPYHLDARRCIAYWTIETQTSIPVALRPHFGNRIFGCDSCQAICPYNRRLPDRTPLLEGLTARQDRLAPALLDGFQPEAPYWLEQEAFARHFRRSPIKRAKRHGMARNVCVALGNWGAPTAVDALALALRDPHPVVREHAAWALGLVGARHEGTAAHALLAAALPDEIDETVQAALQAALAG